MIAMIASLVSMFVNKSMESLKPAADPYMTAAATAYHVFAMVQRAIPMAAMLGVRLAALGARAALGSGSPAALRHYVAMEVCSRHASWTRTCLCKKRRIDWGQDYLAALPALTCLRHSYANTGLLYGFPVRANPWQCFTQKLECESAACLGAVILWRGGQRGAPAGAPGCGAAGGAARAVRTRP